MVTVIGSYIKTFRVFQIVALVGNHKVRVFRPQKVFFISQICNCSNSYGFQAINCKMPGAN